MEFHLFPAGGVGEPEAVRVQALPVHQHGLQFFPRYCAGLFLRHDVGQAQPASFPVIAVADDGIPQGFQVDPDLMRASGLGRYFDEGEAVESFLYLVAADGFLSAAEQDGDFFSVAEVPPERQVYRVGVEAELAFGDGDVFFLERPFAKLQRKAFVRQVGLGHHHHSGCVLVQPVHDAGAQLAGDVGQGIAVMYKSVYERSLEVSRSRMGYQAGRFAHCDDVFVLIQDVEVNRFALDVEVAGQRESERDDLVAADEGIGFARRAVDGHAAVLDELLYQGARERGEAQGEVPVDAPACVVLGDYENPFVENFFLFGQGESASVFRERRQGKTVPCDIICDNAIFCREGASAPSGSGTV